MHCSPAYGQCKTTSAVVRKVTKFFGFHVTFHDGTVKEFKTRKLYPETLHQRVIEYAKGKGLHIMRMQPIYRRVNARRISNV